MLPSVGCKAKCKRRNNGGWEIIAIGTVEEPPTAEGSSLIGNITKIVGFDGQIIRCEVRVDPTPTVLEPKPAPLFFTAYYIRDKPRRPTRFR